MASQAHTCNHDHSQDHGHNHGHDHVHDHAHDHSHTHTHDEENADYYGPMYEMEWVKKGVRQIEDFLQTNIGWLGIDQSRRSRILDYACGNGTVPRALLSKFPDAVFQGLDIDTLQVQRFNDEAIKLLGSGVSQDRMFAIQGDLNEPQKQAQQQQPILDEPAWWQFDAAVISMALHHVSDPVGVLTRLSQRVRRGGVLIVVDLLQPLSDGSSSNNHDKAGAHHEGQHKHQPYEATDMVTASLQGVSKTQEVKIWPGFSMHSIHADMTAAGCTDVDVRVYAEPFSFPDVVPEQVQTKVGGPKAGSGPKMYMAKAIVG